MVAEIAFALALLVSAALTARGGIRLVTQAGGFEPRNLLIFQVPMPESRYPDAGSRRKFTDELERNLRALPGTGGTTVANILPEQDWSPAVRFEAEGQPVSSASERPQAGFRAVSAGFFDVMRIPVLMGRAISDDDREGGRPVAMVSNALAQRLWPNGDAVGKRIRVEDHAGWREIVGVAGDANMYNWWDGVDLTAIYVPFRQEPASGLLHVAVRTQGSPGTLRDRRPFRARGRRSAATHSEPSKHGRRHRSGQSGTPFAGLAAHDLRKYRSGPCGGWNLRRDGLHDVPTGTRIRGPRGARCFNGERLSLTLKNAAALSGIGLTAGTALALVFGTLMASSLPGVIDVDWRVFLVVGPALGLVSVAAAFFPARRALALDPAAILRGQ